MKRSNSYKRGLTEQRADSHKQYNDYVKHPSKINPIFTRKPDYLEPIKEVKGE